MELLFHSLIQCRCLSCLGYLTFVSKLCRMACPHYLPTFLDLVLFQFVWSICNGQTNRSGEASNELPGQRWAEHAERHGSVSQRNPGEAARPYKKHVGLLICHSFRLYSTFCPIVQLFSYFTFLLLAGAQREAEGVWEKGQVGRRQVELKTGASLQELSSPSKKTTKCLKNQ